MAGTETPVVAEVRKIIEGAEDVRNGWSDQQIVAEARRRAGGAHMDRDITSLIAEIRSATDNDGEARHDR